MDGGLTLNSFENKTLGINNVIQGFQFNYDFEWFVVDALIGDYYPSHYEEQNKIGGAQFTSDITGDMTVGCNIRQYGNYTCWNDRIKFGYI